VRELPAFLQDGPARPRAAPLTAARPLAGGRRVPGEAGIWVFILGDMLMFGAFFAAFLVQRGQQPAVFSRARETLTVGFGAVNTLVLLTSSLLVAVAVRAYRADRREDARRLVALAGGCAAVFATIKVVEWIVKLHAGHDPGENLFYTYYFLLTGIHFLHLLIGSVVLAFWWRLLGRPPRPHGERRVVECCASYWHMVDLLWVVLFPVLYLAAT
jgi:nitric oxide reductase NorE protein